MGRRKGIDYEKLSKTDEVSKVLANKIITSQFDFIRYVIERSGFETVRLPYIGRFEVSQKRLYHLNNKDGITKNRERIGGVRQRRGSNGEGVQEDSNKG